MKSFEKIYETITSNEVNNRLYIKVVDDMEELQTNMLIMKKYIAKHNTDRSTVYDKNLMLQKQLSTIKSMNNILKKYLHEG